MDLDLRKDFMSLTSKARGLYHGDVSNEKASAQQKKPSTKQKENQQNRRHLQTTPPIKG